MSAKKKNWFKSDFDDLDDGDFASVDVTSGDGDGGGSMKRSNSGPSTSPLQSVTKRVPSGGSKSFYRGASLDDELFKRKKRTDNDTDMWSIKHRPKSAGDLATHPRKTEEVRQWLKQATSLPKAPKVLLLSGPAGSAKTATLSVLCTELKIEVQEWHNPNTGSWEEGVPYEGQQDAFKRFIARAFKYRALTVSNVGGSRKIVLIEEMPGFLLKDPTLLHQTVDKFKSSAPWPLVIIHSERNKSDSMKKLFPPSVLASISHISFNPVANTNLVKCLSSIAMIESSYGIRSFKIPDKAELTSLAAKVNGDVRAAINALQFGCLNSHQESRAPKRSSAKPGTKMANIGDKDSNFELFHAMGKILYCKRHTDRGREDSLLLGDRTNARAPLQSDPIDVVEKSPLSADPFTCFLHQNYLDFFPDIHAVGRAIDYVSAAEPFFNEWSAGSTKVDLTEYGGLVSAMGMCHPRTQPVKAPGGALKTFSKPEHYSVVAKIRARLPILTQPFVDRRLPNVEVATSLAPFFAHTFKLAKETPAFHEAVTFVANSARTSGHQRIVVNPLERINEGNVILEEEEDLEDEDAFEYEDFLIEEF